MFPQMKYYFLGWNSWFGGGWFHWKSFKFNGGDCFESYRFGSFLLRVYC